MMRALPLSGAHLPLALCLGTMLCGGALFVGPLHAAPIVDADENGPQVQILSPGFNDVIKGKFDITLSVKAGNYNPASIEMFVNDQSATNGSIPLRNLGTSFGWDTRKFIDGPHKLKVIVTDTQGFRGWAEVNVFINNNRIVDDIAPSLDWLNVKKDMTLSGRAQIQLDAKDFFGVKLVKITVNSAAEPDRNPAMATWLLNRPPYVASFDTTRLKDGVYYLRATAWDSSEQQGIAPSLRFGILNNGLNTQTLAEQLRGFKALDSAIEEQEAPKPKAPALSEQPKILPPTVVRSVVPNKVETPRSATAQSGVSKPGAALKKPPVFVAETSKAEVTATPGVLSSAKLPDVRASRELLALAVPEIEEDFTARVGVPNATTRELEPVDEPSLSKIEAPRLAFAGSLETQVQLEVGQDLNAKIAFPGAQERVLNENPALSAYAMEVQTVTSVGVIAQVEVDASQRLEIARLASPKGEARQILDEAAWSASNANTEAQISGLSVPVEVEAPRASAETKVAAPTLQARRLEVEAPAELSVPQAAGARIAAPIATTPLPLEKAAPAKIAAPGQIAKVVAPVKAETPAKISAPAKTTSPKMTAPRGIETTLAQKNTLGIVREKVGQVVRAKNPSKTHQQKMPVMPRVQVAALPQTEKLRADHHVPAITVAPITANVQAMPTSHRVERTTTLRAVAARYGLPVELVAACNNWPVEMNVVKGMTVELPRPLQVSYAGQPVVGDSHSMLVGGTGVTAFRFLFEQAGGKIEWDAKNQRVLAKKGASEIVLTVGSNVAKVNDKDVMMELAAFLFEGRTIVPVRLFEEGLRAQVEWDPQTGRIVVAMLADDASQG